MVLKRICCTGRAVCRREYTKAQLQLTKGMYSGPVDVVRQTLSASGPVGMYRGLSTFIVFAPAAVAVRFAAFDAAQRQVKARLPGADKSTQDFMCGLFSGAMEATFVLVPMETIAITLMHDQMSPNRYAAPPQAPPTYTKTVGHVLNGTMYDLS